MSDSACKAAACSAQCEYGIIDDEFRELTGVVSNLAANNQLTEEQLDDIINLYENFDKEVKRRLRRDREAKEQLKTILDL